MKDYLDYKEKHIATSIDNLEDIDVSDIHPENAFQDEKYYKAMKDVPEIEKQVLYFYEIKMLDDGKIARIVKRKRGEIPELWIRAINHFKQNLERS